MLHIILIAILTSATITAFILTTICVIDNILKLVGLDLSFNVAYAITLLLFASLVMLHLDATKYGEPINLKEIYFIEELAEE